MKNKCIIFLTTTLLCFSFLTATAGNDSEFLVQVFNSNTLILDIVKVRQPQIQILLKDEKGVTLHMEIIKSNSVRHKKYQLEKLPFGKYTLIAQYDNIVKVQPFKKGSEILEIDSLELKTIYKPSFQHTPERLDLTMLCTKDFDITLRMQDAKGHNIYSELLSLAGTLQKRYNLSQLEDGNYTFTITIKENSFEYEFKETFVVNSLIVTK